MMMLPAVGWLEALAAGVCPKTIGPADPLVVELCWALACEAVDATVDCADDRDETWDEGLELAVPCETEETWLQVLHEAPELAARREERASEASPKMSSCWQATTPSNRMINAHPVLKKRMGLLLVANFTLSSNFIPKRKEFIQIRHAGQSGKSGLLCGHSAGCTPTECGPLCPETGSGTV